MSYSRYIHELTSFNCLSSSLLSWTSFLSFLTSSIAAVSLCVRSSFSITKSFLFLIENVTNIHCMTGNIGGKVILVWSFALSQNCHYKIYHSAYCAHAPIICNYQIVKIIKPAHWNFGRNCQIQTFNLYSRPIQCTIRAISYISISIIFLLRSSNFLDMFSL